MGTSDDELRQASDRLLKLEADEPWDAYGDMCLMKTMPAAAIEDGAILAREWKAEHDSTPVDAVWLRPLCERVSDLGNYWYINEERYVSLVQWSGWFHLRYGSESISEQATRGQVRTLCRLLGIPLKERTDGQ